MAINYRVITRVMAGKSEIGTYHGRHQVLRQRESPGPESCRSITLQTEALLRLAGQVPRDGERGLRPQAALRKPLKKSWTPVFKIQVLKSRF